MKQLENSLSASTKIWTCSFYCIGKKILFSFINLLNCFQIYPNGMISIGKKYNRKEPKKLKDLNKDVIAVFWANTDITFLTNITYQVVDRSTPEFIEV